MTDKSKTYTHGDITVVWKPDVCIHSKLCWTQLGEVFDPRARPWVNLAAAESERILEQVSKCPSGALSAYRSDAVSSPEVVTAESRVEVVPNGPLLVYGKLALKLRDGSTQNKSKVTAFCRCGRSANKPFCDGSHVSEGFSDA